jgi:hypothetical protein
MAISLPFNVDLIDAPELVATVRLKHSGKTGRAGRDDRGNSVWEWQVRPGEFTRDIDTQRLRTLEAHHLEIEPHPNHPEPRKFQGLWIHDEE